MYVYIYAYILYVASIFLKNMNGEIKRQNQDSLKFTSQKTLIKISNKYANMENF